MKDNEFRLNVFRKAALCRNFENEAFKKIQQKHIKFPAYLSAGQEYISATIAEVLQNKSIEAAIFIQHRGHSTYLSFGAPISKLIDELLGRSTGCANGMGGSASIQCKEKKIYGHDGLMGSQVPIGVGFCYASKTPTIVYVGDSAVEEGYALSAIGWASTKSLPILFVVEDNNLSILTEKKIRRNWSIDEVAAAFKMQAHNISDDPLVIREHLKGVFKKPLLLNINTKRKYWHSGAGIDDENIFDRYKNELESLGSEAQTIDEEARALVEKIWQKQLEKQ